MPWLVHQCSINPWRISGNSMTRVGDDGLSSIEKLTKDRELSFEGTRITNHGLMHLGMLTNLELLTIQNTNVTDAGLVHLGSLTKLETFYLCFPVSEQGLRILKKMTALKHLYIGDVGPNPRTWWGKTSRRWCFLSCVEPCGALKSDLRLCSPITISTVPTR